MTDTSSEDILQTATDLRWRVGENFHDALVESLYASASDIAAQTIETPEDSPRLRWERRIDQVLTSRWTGIPVMLGLLTLVFWITIVGANYPSGWLSSVLVDTLHPLFKQFAGLLHSPWWLTGVLFDGMYLSMAWVVSVMLPPMAIFFPLFTLLEDLGYLPRVAFNLDHIFKKVGAHGKQALSLSMGFGCNAAGVIATRIIDSPRERLIAIITNNFALCNGRWPTQILIASLFIGALVPASLAGFISAGAVVGVALLGVFLTFLTSWLLSRSLLKGEPSAFSLELPPYRPPRVLQTLYTSLIDRTLFVLWRAVVFALPAGAVIWLLANIRLGDATLATHLIDLLHPLGYFMGLNGVILVAYVIAIPANEIVIPTILMLTVMATGLTEYGAGSGVMFELENYSSYLEVFRAGGWTLLTAVNIMIFSLVHNPCSTTLYTIYKETRSVKWTAVSGVLPLLMGILLCGLIAQLVYLIH